MKMRGEDDDGEDEIGDRAGRHHRGARANLLVDEADLLFFLGHGGRGVLVGHAGGIVVAEEFHIAAERNRRHLPARAVAVVEADDLGAETDGEREYLDAAAPGDQEMAKLMKKHDNRQDKQERDDIGRQAPRQTRSSRAMMSKCILPSSLPSSAARELPQVYYDAFTAISGKRSCAKLLAVWSMCDGCLDSGGFGQQTAPGGRDPASPPPRPIMPVKPMRPAMNSATATSSAAFSTVGAPPARLHDPPRQRQAPGNAPDRAPRRSIRAPAPDRDGRPAPSMRCGQARQWAIGIRMSGEPSWATTEPSRNSTSPCTTDCGCTSTSICAGGQREQVMRLDQFEALVHHAGGIDGDLRAHRPVGMAQRLLRAWRRGSPPALQVRNGPPEAVRMMRLTSSRGPAPSAWKIALCSESTGSTVAPTLAARRMNRLPAQTRHSLLASATVAPRSIAARVGLRPMAPRSPPSPSRPGARRLRPAPPRRRRLRSRCRPAPP